MSSRLKAKFGFSGFAKGVAMLAGGTAAGQALGILMMPVFTRMFTPEEFGGLAVYSSILGILIVIASMRYELAIPQAKTNAAAANIVFLSLTIVVILSSILALVVHYWGYDILILMGDDFISDQLWLLPISFFLVGFHNVLFYWLTRTKTYSVITQTKILQSLGQVAARLGYGFYQQGVFGLIIANVISQSAGLTIMTKRFVRYMRKQKPRISWRRMALLAKRYVRFPKFMVLSSLMNSCSLHFPALLIASLFGAENAGYYLVAQNILGIPFILIGQSVSQVFHAEAADLYRNKPEELLPLFYSVSKKLFFVGLIPVVSLLLIGEWAFGFFLGENWLMAGKFSAVLSFMFLLRFSVAPVSNLIFIIERQQVSVLFQALLLTGSVISLFGAVHLHATINEAILLFSITMGFCYILMYLIYIFELKKFSKRAKVRK